MKPNVTIVDDKWVYLPLKKKKRISFIEKNKNEIQCLVGIILYGSGIVCIGLLLWWNHKG